MIELQSLLNSNNVSPWAADIIHRNGPTLDNPWQGRAGGNPFPFDWRDERRSSPRARSSSPSAPTST